MFSKPAVFLLAVWLGFLCGPSLVDAQYRIGTNEKPRSPRLARLPAVQETPAAAPNSQLPSMLLERPVATPPRTDSQSLVVPASSQSGPVVQSPVVQGPVVDQPGPVAYEESPNWNGGQTDYLSPYMTQSPELGGFFFQYDHLVWSLAGEPDMTAQWITGGETYDLNYGLNTEVTDGRIHSGERFEFGHMECDRGWFGSIMFGEGDREAYGGDVVFVPQPTADQVALIDHFEFAGAELNRNIRYSPSWELFYGIRYLDFRESYLMVGSSSLIELLYVESETKNQIIGPQLGARFNTPFYRFILNLEGRFVPGYNHQSALQYGDITLSDTFVAIGQTTDDDEFSPIGEIRADIILPINRFAAFRLGYTGLVVGGVSLGSTNVTVYDSELIGDFGIAEVDSSEALFINALTLGIEINR